MRNTDRLITPGVVVTFLIVAGFCTALTIVGVGYLTSRGLDPDPMIRLVVQVVGAAGAVFTAVLQLANNARSAKTERNTTPLAPDGKPVDLQAELADVRGAQDRMADALYAVADALPRPVPRHSYPETVATHGAAPAPRGE